MLQASKEWRWIRCSHRNRLLVDLGEDLQLCTPFRLRQLTEDSLHSVDLSVDEAAFYRNVYDYLLGFKVWSEPQCCQIALNATAAKFHLLPVQAKSWFFNCYNGGQPLCEAVVTLQSRCQSGEFLIVDHNQETSMCINLTQGFMLDENIELEQFQAIKVLNDRVHPLIQVHKMTQTA
ncbi:cell division protein ZapC domain-containing protein [Pseudoalteromonas rubra]|uniref:Cell division protein ZapC n=1 Tax=Pseudoalteromonas rubra TaxID=43658 RepID=A0A0U3GFC2_9GAMM|nr:cell division protein ZapC domain-containing protein [Pseudoalteromonas rubra]ALU41787.1 cell division protein ZapC [Pseudoalteromonas rubra]